MVSLWDTLDVFNSVETHIVSQSAEWMQTEYTNSGFSAYCYFIVEGV